MPERNSWKLCSKHCGCPKCKKALACWKNKAQKHSAKAQALKFSLMCVLDERSETIVSSSPDRCLTVEEVRAVNCNRENTGELPTSCGICREKYTIGGEGNMVALGCGHTIDIRCCKMMNKAECPYCRADIKKAIVLYYENYD